MDPKQNQQTIHFEIQTKKLPAGEHHTALILFYTTGGFSSVPLTLTVAPIFSQRSRSYIIITAAVLIAAFVLSVVFASLINRRALSPPESLTVPTGLLRTETGGLPAQPDQGNPIPPGDEPAATPAEAVAAMPPAEADEKQKTSLALSTPLDDVELVMDGTPAGTLSSQQPRLFYLQ